MKLETTHNTDLASPRLPVSTTGNGEILLLGATFGTGNMGVGALTAGALTIASRAFPHARIALLDYARNPTTSSLRVGDRVVEAPLVNLRFTWKLFLKNNVALLIVLALLARLAGPRLGKRILRANRTLDVISRADLALALSGGDSFSDIYGVGRFMYVTLPQILLVLLGRNLVLLPQTVGPFAGRPARALARWLLRQTDRVHVRDLESLQTARALLGTEQADLRVRFCNDVGFVVEPHCPQELNAGALDLEDSARVRPIVGINISGLLAIGGYSRRNMFALKVDYINLMEACVRMFIDDHNVDVLLVPHVFGTSDESDVNAIDKLYWRLAELYAGRVFRVAGHYDQNELKYVIGKCDFFVGARMHACIAALSQAVPAIGVAYSNKFSGVFASVGTGDLVVDLRTCELDSAIGRIGEAYCRRAELSAILARTLPAVKARVLGLLGPNA